MKNRFKNLYFSFKNLFTFYMEIASSNGRSDLEIGELFPIKQTIRRLMDNANMSEADLCRGVNLPQTTINRLLSGQTEDPRISTLALIARFFDISIEQLIGAEKLVLSEAWKQAKGSIVPIISWNHVSQWLVSNSTKDEEQVQWAKTEKTLEKNSFGLQAPAIYEQVLGRNCLLIMNRTSDISQLNGDVVLVGKGEHLSLQQVIVEGKSVFLRRLFQPFAVTEADKATVFYAHAVEFRNTKITF